MSKFIMELAGWLVVTGSAWSLPAAEFAAVMLGLVVIIGARHVG